LHHNHDRHVSDLTFLSHACYVFHFEIGWGPTHKLTQTVQHLARTLSERHEFNKIKSIWVRLDINGNSEIVQGRADPVAREIVRCFREHITGVSEVGIDLKYSKPMPSNDRVSSLRRYCAQAVIDMMPAVKPGDNNARPV